MPHLFRYTLFATLLASVVFGPELVSAVTLQDLQNQAASLLGTSSTQVVTPCLSLTRTLKLASTDRENAGQVTKLQQFLHDRSYYFGLIGGVVGYSTERAIQAFQRDNGLVSSGDPATTGFGAVGPKTRAKIRALSCGSQTAVSGSGGVTITRQLQRGSRDASTGGQVSLLQTFLSQQKYYAGSISGVFDLSTEQAVQAFQRANKIISSGTPTTTGFGTTGPKTRAKIKTISLAAGSSSLSSSPVSQAANDSVNTSGDGVTATPALASNLNPDQSFIATNNNLNTGDVGSVGIGVSTGVTQPDVVPSVATIPSLGTNSGPLNASIQTPGFGRSGNTITMIAPATIVFSGAASTGAITRYDWNFGDASNSAYPQTQEGFLVGHRFDNPGTFTVTLDVSDQAGNHNSSSLTVSVVSRPSTAKTYYIDNNGSNNNDGLSPATAWHDIQKFYSASPLVAATFYDKIPDGSRILFHAGQTFDTKGDWQLARRDPVDSYQLHTLLRPAPYYISIGSYGAGARPVIMSSASLTNNNYGSNGILNIIDPAGTTNGRGIIIDGLEIRGSVWDRAYLFGNPLVSERPGLNVIMRNTKITNGQFINWGSDGFVFEQGEIDGTLAGAVSLGSAADPHFSYISQSNIYGSPTHCIYLSGASQNSLIENNNIHDCGSDGSHGGITAHGQQYNWDIRGNNIYNNNYAIGIDANVDWPDYLQNIVIENNKIYGNNGPSGHTFQLASIKNLTIKNNNIYNNPGASAPVFWFRGASTVQDASNIQIYGNTISGNTSGVFSISPHTTCPNSPGTTCDGTQDIHFKNNTIVGGGTPILIDSRTYAGSNIRQYLDFASNTYTGFTPSANLFISPAGTQSLTTWQQYESGAPLAPSPTPIVNPPAPTPTPTPTPVFGPTIDLSSGLLAYFSFDSFANRSTSDSAGGRTATCSADVNCPIGGPGKLGQDLLFNGTTTYLSIPNDGALNPSSAISLSAWIKPIDWNGNRRVIQKGLSDNQYRLTAEFGAFKFHLAGLPALTGSFPAVGAWTQVVGTYDGQTMKLYENGTLVASQAASGPISVTSDPLFVGSKSDTTVASGDHFSGEIDEVRVYNRALNLQEIQTLAGVPVTYNNFALTQMANAWQVLNQVWFWIWHQILLLSQWLWSWLGLHFN